MPTSPVVDLSEKVALVTGAGSGIGRASAIRYAQAGACVMCADIDADGAKVTAESIRGEGGEAASLQLDVTDESAVEKSLQQTIDALGGFDILFNNAGIGDIDYQKTLDVNQNGVYYGLKHGSAVLAERGGGAIVNYRGDVRISRSTFRGNVAAKGVDGSATGGTDGGVVGVGNHVYHHGGTNNDPGSLWIDYDTTFDGKVHAVNQASSDQSI